MFHLPKKWQNFLNEGSLEECLLSIQSKLEKEFNEGKIIFPSSENIFKSLELVAPENVKVVIIGQDPYHNFNQANGLAFSVSRNQPLPPSLKNIFIEMSNDLKKDINCDGNFEEIAKQGVLFLNSILTVEAHKPGSHKDIGWEKLTDLIIASLSDQNDIAFILWGNFAKNKEHLIDQDHNLVITSSHPSPFSANISFFGSKPFSKCNLYLNSVGKNSINWTLD